MVNSQRIIIKLLLSCTLKPEHISQYFGAKIGPQDNLLILSLYILELDVRAVEEAGTKLRVTKPFWRHRSKLLDAITIF